MAKTITDFLNEYLSKADGGVQVSPSPANAAGGSADKRRPLISFHMPGHKGRPDLYERTGYGDILRNIVTIDITEIPGADALFCPETTLRAVMDNYAELYGAKHTELLVNGSSAGVMAAIIGTVPVGGKLILARNSHHSAFSALRLGGINPVYVRPKTDPRSSLVGEITAADLKAACAADPDAEAVLVASPNYYGMLSDIAALAAVAHEYGMLLIVDQAHGAHLKFFDNDADELQSEGAHIPFPKHSAEALGADIVINSTHKTLLSFTGSGILNICSDSVDIASVSDALRMLQTTSPSYLLMASLDINEKIMRKFGSRIVRAWRDDITTFYRRAMRIPGVEIVGGQSAAEVTERVMQARSRGADSTISQDRPQGTGSTSSHDRSLGTDGTYPHDRAHGSGSTSSQDRPLGSDGTYPHDRAHGSDGTYPHDRPQGSDGTYPHDRPQGSDGTYPHDRPQGSGSASSHGSSQGLDDLTRGTLFTMYHSRAGLDMTKINISMASLGLSGARLERELRQRGIIAEMVHGDYVMLMTGAGSRSGDYTRLLEALKEISDVYGIVDTHAGSKTAAAYSAAVSDWQASHGSTGLKGYSEDDFSGDTPAGPEGRAGSSGYVPSAGYSGHSFGAPGNVVRTAEYAGNAGRTPRRTGEFDLEVAGVPFEAESVPLYSAVGSVLYDPVIIYPPGTPVACPGEILTVEVISFISDAIGRGEKVTGVDDEGMVRVGPHR